jgi:hypothetical protein
MLGLLSRFAPATVFAIGLALGALPAGAAGWMTRGLMFDWLERPAIIRTQQALCTAEVQAAAAKARADEQLRLFRAGELATEQFIQQATMAADDRQAALDLLQLESERYAAALSETRRICALDLVDLEYLGVLAPGPPAGGR